MKNIIFNATMCLILLVNTYTTTELIKEKIVGHSFETQAKLIDKIYSMGLVLVVSLTYLLFYFIILLVEYIIIEKSNKLFWKLAGMNGLDALMLVVLILLLKPSSTSCPNNLLFDRRINEPAVIVCTIYKVTNYLSNKFDISKNTPILIKQPDSTIISVGYFIN
jgi:hypothetical protein